MPGSDPDYHRADSSDPDDHILPTSASRRRPARARATQAWEAAASKNWDLQESSDGTLLSVLGGLEEASKRARLVLKDTTPLQRGIIRHTLLVLDLSSAMNEKDLRPTRLLLTLNYTVGFIEQFFEQNPISQLGILGMRDGVALRVSDLSGDPQAHIAAVRALRGQEAKGNPSLQNALEMARAGLHHTPSHGTREVVIVLGALLSSDPGDIHDSIRGCVRDGIRVGIIGLAARMHICQEIVERTNGGDGAGYAVAVDEVAFRELLAGVTTPPVVHAGDADMARRNTPGLLMMGFPSRRVGPAPSLCACHGKPARAGYDCSRCGAKVCGLPASCPACGLTLILSTHLARSYHHLFPLRNWAAVSWVRAAEVGSAQCAACLAPFPDVPVEHHQQKRRRSVAQVKDAEGASESSRYECAVCAGHFCIDCDVFCHEVVHNCPGCQSGGMALGEEDVLDG